MFCACADNAIERLTRPLTDGQQDIPSRATKSKKICRKGTRLNELVALIHIKQRKSEHATNVTFRGMMMLHRTCFFLFGSVYDG
jgi:hypothetical protein